MEKLQILILFTLFFRFGSSITKEALMYDRKEQDFKKYIIGIIASIIVYATLILLVYNYKTIF